MPEGGVMARESAVVAIPVYKAALTTLEVMSLVRCAEVLGRHPLTFFGPSALDFSAYRTAVPDATITPFDDRYFRSLAGYSELLVTPAFYEAFAGFDFLLIYQLDAFVFEDRLAQWCAQGYDYLGAPWLDTDGRWQGVGNGGFSLRRVAACLDALGSTRRLSAQEVWAQVRHTTPSVLVRGLKYHRKLLAHLGLCNDLAWFLRRWVRRGEPEDMFWGLHAARFHPPFRVAPPEVALHFAVEGWQEQAWRKLAGRPPFGCHRDCIIQMLHRYVNTQEQPQSELERTVWVIAEAARLRKAVAGGIDARCDILHAKIANDGTSL
jgi:hypothetical protein